MPMPIDFHSNLPGHSDIMAARAQGRSQADHARDRPLLMVAIHQAYFRMIAWMAMKSGNPEEALEAYLEIDAASARNELQALREAGL